jgi:hypothetical protein
MNVNPDAPNSNPFEDDSLKGLDWVRFVFKVDAQIDPGRRNLAAAFAQYDPIITAYAAHGVGSLLILNQETVWGNAPWHGGDWNEYAGRLAGAAGQIAAHYAHLGDRIAYEIWNEGDVSENTPSIFVPAATFAQILRQTAVAIRAAAPQAKIVFGGLAAGPPRDVNYVLACRQALGGELPVDAIGLHPYGRWAVRRPFDGWGFGTLQDALAAFERALPGVPLWITEIGVPGDLGEEHYPAIAGYLRDV